MVEVEPPQEEQVPFPLRKNNKFSFGIRTTKKRINAKIKSIQNR